MAIIINQQPTSPNMSNNDLLFTLTSNQIGQPQFQYVCDIYEYGSLDYLQRIKQQPNPSGYGVFNIGQILTYNLESDNLWKTQYFATASYSSKQFVALFGESYAPTDFATSSYYDGIQNVTPGEPAKQGDDFYQVVDGLVDYPNAVNFNFASQSYYQMEPASVYNTFNYQHVLSNAPTTQYINDGEYATITLFNGNQDETTVVAQDIYFVQYNVYNSSGVNIQNFDITNIEANGGGPRINPNDLWSDGGVADGQSSGTRMLYIGVGPQNIDDGGTTLNPNWAYYTVSVYGQGDDGLENSDAVWAQLRFNKSTGDCAYNGVRFAWKNEFGVWDYYTFTLQSDSVDTIERKTYEKTFVPYNTPVNTAIYNTERRGTTSIVNILDRNQTANSSWLTQTEADWLRELFFSTNVFIQNGNDFEPVVILDTTLVEKTNPRTQKNFQYQIGFKQSNNLRNRK